MTALMRKLSNILFASFQGGIPCEINDMYVGNTANKTTGMSTLVASNDGTPWTGLRVMLVVSGILGSRVLFVYNYFRLLNTWVMNSLEWRRHHSKDIFDDILRANVLEDYLYRFDSTSPLHTTLLFGESQLDTM